MEEVHVTQLQPPFPWRYYNISTVFTTAKLVIYQVLKLVFLFIQGYLGMLVRLQGGILGEQLWSEEEGEKNEVN